MGLRPYSKEDYMDIFADNLADLMEKRGFDDISLAKEAHMKSTTILGYKNRRTLPTIKSIVNLTHALGCSIEELIDFGAPIKQERTEC